MKITKKELGNHRPLVKQLEDNQPSSPSQESLKRKYHCEKHVHQNHLTQQLEFQNN